MEHIEGIHLLTDTDELDGLLHHRTDSESRTTTGVAVQLGQHHAVEVQAVVEGLGRVHGILTRHGIDHKQGLMRMHRFLDVGDFVHHLLINGQTTSGIDDDDILALTLSVLDGVLRNLYWILVAFLAIDFNLNLLTQHLQLLDSSRTIHVASHQQHLLAAFALQIRSQLGRERGLTRALQTRNQNNARLAFQVNIDGIATHQFGQLVVHNLNHHLARFHRSENLLAEGFFLNVIGDILGNLIADVGIQKGATDFLHRIGHVHLSDIGLSFKDFERTF